jgi:hypothetical protein
MIIDSSGLKFLSTHINQFELLKIRLLFFLIKKYVIQVYYFERKYMLNCQLCKLYFSFYSFICFIPFASLVEVFR